MLRWFPKSGSFKKVFPMLMLMIALVALGAVTGFFAGLLGLGGGMMLVPFMTFLFTLNHFPADQIVKMAIATSLATILFTSVSSLRAHHKKGAVRWAITKPMGIGAFIGTFVGANFAGALRGEWLAAFFAIFVGISALQMLRDKKPKPSREVPKALGLGFVGAGIGFISSLVGAGGGFITTPFLVWCNVVMHHAIGTSAAIGLPIAAGGLIGYIIAGWNVSGLPAGSAGYIYLPALFATAAATLLTAPLGARTAHRMDVASLKRVFAFLLLGLALYMASKAI
jgi:uncharacterized membrane protein YfcA